VYHAGVTSAGRSAAIDPLYHTAFPNPRPSDFVGVYGAPYDPAADTYRREPYAVDVSEGKTGPIYSAHCYHTRVSHKAIVQPILHYTKPCDLVLDCFTRSGMTAVAAQLYDQPDPKIRHEVEKGRKISDWTDRWSGMYTTGCGSP